MCSGPAAITFMWIFLGRRDAPSGSSLFRSLRCSNVQYSELRPLPGNSPPSETTLGRLASRPTIVAPPGPQPSTIELLKRRGYLTDMTEEEEESFFSGIVAEIHKSESVGVPLYLFMTTYDCNLRCGYCFQDHMRTNPAFGHLLTRMTPSVVDRIFAAMPRLEAHHGLGSNHDLPRNIIFFGGEPLLEANRPIVEYIIIKANRMGRANFTAITNGTDLHAYQDLLGPGVCQRSRSRSMVPLRNTISGVFMPMEAGLSIELPGTLRWLWNWGVL